MDARPVMLGGGRGPGPPGSRPGHRTGGTRARASPSTDQGGAVPARIPYVRLMRRRAVQRVLGRARRSACSVTASTRSRSASSSCDATGSPGAPGLVFLAAALPNLLLGPIAGTFVDRWDQKRVMVASDLIRARPRAAHPTRGAGQHAAGLSAGVPGHDREPLLPARARRGRAAHRGPRRPARPPTARCGPPRASRTSWATRSPASSSRSWAPRSRSRSGWTRRPTS